MAKTTREKIELKMAEKEQLENELKRLMQQQKEADRKARTNRLCKRGGLLESMMPDTVPLTEDNFKLFLEKTVANEYGRRTLAALKAGQEKQTAPTGTDAAARGGEPDVEKPAEAKRDGSNSSAVKPANITQGSGAVAAVKAGETSKPGVAS
jgi:hypothetical protein